MLNGLFGCEDNNNMILIIIVIFLLLCNNDSDCDCDCDRDHCRGGLGGLFGGDNIIWILILICFLGDFF
ncbi:hypothetical protein RBU61_04560 [Tissierella sp. MB52-C2]|uniref:hypothetical protein n=1 Tax=Tissierella sp. MB52-C2 TaxID=3070999 RepID=UPI00280B90B3|nr:hypothetical protein [Tissierella sp. MB52-C2]WMM25948.1 hypothetical protein RBU61_04560 [Tissierella sp. MB52-C2]